MSDRNDLDDLTVEELEQLLYIKKRSVRRSRLRRLKAEGRVVEVNDAAAPDSLSAGEEELAVDQTNSGGSFLSQDDSPVSEREAALADITSMLRQESTEEVEVDDRGFIPWRLLGNRVLLVVEIGAVVGLLFLAFTFWQSSRELNEEIAEIQSTEIAGIALPSPTSTPVIGVVVLPSGHKPPVNGRPPEPGEAGNIPDHLLPIIDAYVPPPIPTPGPQQARRIQIPSIELDKPIVQGDEWEQLKKGVGQHVGTGLPGNEGNLVLSAHNDIYGEIFRHLDQINPGDEIVISTERQSYAYVVREIQVVEPTDVWVMAPTNHASTTLISCYPYLVNDKRIVVFADLAGPLS